MTGSNYTHDVVLKPAYWWCCRIPGAEEPDELQSSREGRQQGRLEQVPDGHQGEERGSPLKQHFAHLAYLGVQIRLALQIYNTEREASRETKTMHSAFSHFDEKCRM